MATYMQLYTCSVRALTEPLPITQIVQLYARGSVNDDPSLKTGRNVAHAFLRELCTSPINGIVFGDARYRIIDSDVFWLACHVAIVSLYLYQVVEWVSKRHSTRRRLLRCDSSGHG